MTPLPPEVAETVALEVLGWLVGNDELLPVFQGATGASEADLRHRVKDPEFLVSVMDFLMMDDAWVQAFCQETGRGFDDPIRARAGLPGGEMVNWT